MKCQMLLLAAVLILALALLGACAPPNRQIYYGTWTNEKAYFQKTVRTSDGIVENYYLVSDVTPSERASAQIIDCWSDSDGNVWFRTQGTVSEGPNMKTAPKVQTLERISKSGAFLEVMINGVVAFSPKSFPTKIDPSPQKLREHLYRAFNRAGR